MRLTLRTLLAWLDGVLSEGDRKALAAKVAASPVAPRLIERIKEVMAHPGLSAPEPGGSGLTDDANSVSEFLDNALPADRLEGFERICLESEIHLAEVADCHALLAELTRDTAAAGPLDPPMQSRLRKIVAREISQDAIGTERTESGALGKLVQDATAPRTKPGVPIVRQKNRSSLGAWLSVAGALALVAALGGVLVWQVWRPVDRGRQVAVTDGAKDVTPREVVAPVAEEAPTNAPAAEPEETSPQSGRDDPSGVPPQTADQNQPGEATEVPAAEPEPPTVAVPAPEEPVVVPLPVMEADPPLVDPDPEAVRPEDVPRPPPPAPATVVSGGPLLRRVGGGDAATWRAVGAGGPLGDAEEFVVPVHVYPQIARGDLVIRLSPGTRCATTVDRDGTPRLEVVFGRAVVWTEAARAEVGITAGGLSGRWTLGPRQPIGIDVALTRERGTDPTVVPPGRSTTIFATGGGLWRQTENDGGPPGVPLAGVPIEQPLPPRGGLMWDSSAAGAARMLPPAVEPGWMRVSAPTGRVERLAAMALTSALAADVPAAESLELLAGSRLDEDRIAAAATLALLGSYGPLVEMLCEDSPDRRLCEGEWTLLETSTVPLALSRGSNAAAGLRQAFDTLGPAGRGAEIFLLARGLSPDELAGGGAEGLVASLEDPALVVRRYASANLVALLPDPAEATWDRRLNGSGRLNDKGIAWWRERVAAGLPGRRADAGGEP